MEIAIKTRLGKLKFPDNLEHLIPHHLRLAGIEVLPVQRQHALHVYGLPDHHRDPFDHLLVAQAQLEKLPLVTANPLLTPYGISI
ncbi:MAG TPA: type II toxin-antitoxin system VapC family toxin [Anaerolineae bacterium]|jgi:PIN domain nuclease of toxin-antitoxin system